MIFAETGSGKTVLLRRIIEECALRGVSAIVLDPNNDLARLGDEWPRPPANWGPDDERIAKEYFASTVRPVDGQHAQLNSPAQIVAANEMARAKGSTVPDISLLERGQFYVTGEAFGFRRIQTSLCLSHHSPGPLRLEEVVDRARNGPNAAR